MRVLVLCTGNSCRSILGEVLLNELSGGRIEAFSAGGQPTGKVNPGALAILERMGHSTEGLESKSWDRFTGPDAPAIDVVITVCDSAAGESCPYWNGAPVTVHWGIPDPADASEEDREAAFQLTYLQLRSRIDLMLELPLESIDERHMKDALQRIHDAASMQERTGEY